MCKNQIKADDAGPAAIKQGMKDSVRRLMQEPHAKTQEGLANFDVTMNLLVGI